MHTLKPDSDPLFELSPFVQAQFNKTSTLFSLVDDDLDLSEDWCEYCQKNISLDAFSLLRKYRQSRLALIAVQESIQNNLLHALKQTSKLAKILIKCAYEYALKEIEEKHGEVTDEKGQKQSFVIFALGKLGGNELNYSSDVDLVFCYTGKGQSNGKKSLDAQSYFIRLARRIINLLEIVTADGIVYRVDMRLRPFGSASPLVCSVDNLLSYLENEGRDWERYAWLRASSIVGNKIIAGNTLNHIRPFVYRKYLDFNIFDSLRQIKEQIIREQKNQQNNIKLGKGGIREIEFIVQTLQITFGGRNKRLQGNDLWEQLTNLKEENHISVNKYLQLSKAWIFLRRLENFCQIKNDQAIHHLPKELSLISLCMGYKAINEFKQDYNLYTTNVNNIFNSVFFVDSSRKKELVDRNIQKVKDEISKKKHPKYNKHKLYSALDAVDPYLSKFENKDEILARYRTVLFAISKKISYLSMLIESPLVVEKLINKLAISGYFSKEISKTPSLLELFFEALEVSDFDIKDNFDSFLARKSIENREQYHESIVEFKNQMHFKIISAYVDKMLSVKQTGVYISDLAAFIIELIIKEAWNQCNRQKSEHIRVDELIVVAYGSLAIKSMHLNSDVDLVFVCDKKITQNNHKFIMRWIKKIIHLLTLQTYFGSLYEIDTKLRPNGNAGTVVVTNDGFENYQMNEAWVWEHAALIKSSAIYGSKAQKHWFNRVRKQVLTQKRDKNEVTDQLKEMESKLDNHSNKNHQGEFERLREILIKANLNEELIEISKIFENNKEIYEYKLNQSILS